MLRFGRPPYPSYLRNCGAEDWTSGRGTLEKRKLGGEEPAIVCSDALLLSLDRRGGVVVLNAIARQSTPLNARRS